MNVQRIASKYKESREHFKGNKKIEAAYCVKSIMMHGDDGKISGMEYEIFEEPYTAVEAEEHNGEKGL